jgi:protein-tyrosine phosphatase
MVNLLNVIFDVAIKLIEDPKLVIAAHCRAGKGRTGTFVSSLVLLFNIFDSVQDVKQYYESKRQVTVTKKSQLRNIFYLWDFLNDRVKQT